MARQVEHRPLPVYEIPPESLAEWPDDRITCASCRNKSGIFCQALSRPGRHITIVPTDIPHHCSAYRERGK